MNIRLEQVVLLEPNQTLDSSLLSIVFRFANAARINVNADATRTVDLTFSRCPNITFVLAHSGGTLPVMAGRIKDRYPKGKVYEDRNPNGVLYELKRLHFEVAHATFSEPLAALLKFVPSSQVHFGTDYPAEPIASTVENLPGSGLSAEVLRSIDRGNAERLFPRLKT